MHVRMSPYQECMCTCGAGKGEGDLHISSRQTSCAVYISVRMIHTRLPSVPPPPAKHNTRDPTPYEAHACSHEPLAAACNPSRLMHPYTQRRRRLLTSASTKAMLTPRTPNTHMQSGHSYRCSHFPSSFQSRSLCASLNAIWL